MAQIKWISDAEKQEEELLESLLPNKEEIEAAEFDLKIISLLMEVNLL